MPRCGTLFANMLGYRPQACGYSIQSRQSTGLASSLPKRGVLRRARVTVASHPILSKEYSLLVAILPTGRSLVLIPKRLRQAHNHSRAFMIWIIRINKIPQQSDTTRPKQVDVIALHPAVGHQTAQLACFTCDFLMALPDFLHGGGLHVQFDAWA